MSDIVDGSMNLTTHEQFNENVKGTDVIIQSSDGVIFHLHRRYLQVNAVIPGFDIDNPHPKNMTFDEPCNVLEILFQFIYPRRQPSLEDTDFETLLAVAEAVEKYQVFVAMTLCEMRLKKFLPCDEHHDAIRILAHACKYNNAKLINEAALCLCRTPSDLEVAEQLPPAFIIPWVGERPVMVPWLLSLARRLARGLKYRKAWKSVFDTRIRMAMKNYLTSDRCHDNISREHVCTICVTAFFAWFLFLENLDRLSDLKSSIMALGDQSTLSSQYKLVSHRFGESNFSDFSERIQRCCGRGNCQGPRCYYRRKELEKLCKDIDAIPPFTDFIKSD